MTFDALYAAHAAELEDFWGRRQTAPNEVWTGTLFGRPLQVRSNDAVVLTAVDHSISLYSTAPRTTGRTLTVDIIVREAGWDPGPPPADLMNINQYSGVADWLAIQCGGWGHAHVDMGAGWGRLILTPQLAAQPEIVSRGLLNTVFNNLLNGQGFPMLHCSGLLRGDGRLILLMAPHNSGKSTTAFRLMRAGYRLLSDSQIYISPDVAELQLLGFPVGVIKLRGDMVASFPDVADRLVAEAVRDETKYRLPIAAWRSEAAMTTAVYPTEIDLCLLSRVDGEGSTVKPADAETVGTAVMANSLYYDRAPAWRRNLAQVDRLLAVARPWHLAIGRDPAGIVAAVDAL